MSAALRAGLHARATENCINATPSAAPMGMRHSRLGRVPLALIARSGSGAEKPERSVAFSPVIREGTHASDEPPSVA
jgi:hypothetical protein